MTTAHVAGLKIISHSNLSIFIKKFYRKSNVFQVYSSINVWLMHLVFYDEFMSKSLNFRGKYVCILNKMAQNEHILYNITKCTNFELLKLFI